jgi:hypothetical protein
LALASAALSTLPMSSSTWSNSKDAVVVMVYS